MGRDVDKCTQENSNTTSHLKEFLKMRILLNDGQEGIKM